MLQLEHGHQEHLPDVGISLVAESVHHRRQELPDLPSSSQPEKDHCCHLVEVPT